MVSSPGKQQVENSRRERLRLAKPLVYEKVIHLDEKFARGECVAMVDITFNCGYFLLIAARNWLNLPS